MYLVLNYKLVLCGNYLIKSFDILISFINRFNLVFSASSTPFSIEEKTGVTIWYQSGVPSRLRPGMAIYGIQISTVFNLSELRFKKKNIDTKKSSIIRLVLRVFDLFFFAGEDQVYVRFFCFPSRVLLLS